MKKNELKSLGYSNDQISSFKMLRKLIHVPDFIWNNEIAPIMEKLGLKVPTGEFKVEKWINFDRMINEISLGAFRKISFLCVKRANDVFARQLAKMLLNKIGFVLIKRDDNYSFSFKEGKQESVVEFLNEISTEESIVEDFQTEETQESLVKE